MPAIANESIIMIRFWFYKCKMRIFSRQY